MKKTGAFSYVDIDVLPNWGFSEEQELESFLQRVFCKKSFCAREKWFRSLQKKRRAQIRSAQSSPATTCGDLIFLNRRVELHFQTIDEIFVHRRGGCFGAMAISFSVLARGFCW